jgi:hypothetical protein
VVILGEAHLKLKAASDLGKEVVRRFDLRGVETFQTRRVVGGRLLGFLIHMPRRVLRGLSLGAVKDSTIKDAKALDTGVTYELERTDAIPVALHVASVYLSALFTIFYSSFFLNLAGIDVPWLHWALLATQIHLIALAPAYALRSRPWAWIIHPAIGLLTSRDMIMAEGTVRMLSEHPEPTAAVVVMGRAHLPGYERELVEKHGFTRATLV